MTTKMLNENLNRLRTITGISVMRFHHIISLFRNTSLALIFALLSVTTVLPSSAAIAGGASGGHGAISGGGTSDASGGASAAAVAALEAEIAAVEASITAAISKEAASQSTDAASVNDSSSGESSCGTDIACSLRLQKEYRKILLKLLSTYYALGTEGKENSPQQAEMIANLVANVISFKR